MGAFFIFILILYLLSPAELCTQKIGVCRGDPLCIHQIFWIFPLQGLQPEQLSLIEEFNKILQAILDTG